MFIIVGQESFFMVIIGLHGMIDIYYRETVNGSNQLHVVISVSDFHAI